MKRIGFIGLGKMGSGICRNLIAKGYSVTVFDISKENLQMFASIAQIANNREQLVDESEVIFLSLPGSIQVEETVHAFIGHGVAGKTIIDLSTSYPLSSEKLHDEVRQAGGQFADASLSGTPTHAEQGALIVTFGGDLETFQACAPIIESFASRGIHHMGAAGSGNIAKLVNNYLAIMYTALYAEIFPLAEKMGFDTHKLFEIIGQSGVNCPMYQMNGAKIVNQRYDPAFSLDFALKDITYVKRLYEEYQVPSFVLDGGLTMLRIGHLKGYGGNDLSELAKVAREHLEQA
ncbi:MAG: NAD-binding protein [Paenibacillus sp.]|jgi:3-hydroxyisobutyrate dehydrogenase-like beta-hydroxyacid dehydrogenase|nr:NAD-binding protein [Paenibacillus sp.]